MSANWNSGRHAGAAMIGTLVLALMLITPAAASQKDKIFLKDEQILTGELVNSTFRFNTIYGTFEVPNAACQRIERKNERVELLHSVNREVISGYITENPRLKISNGPELSVQKELIKKLVFAPRKKLSITGKDYFQMKNGDVFYGDVLDTSFRFTTSYGTLNTEFSSLLKLEDVNGQTRMYLADGNTMMGFIATDVIRIRSVYGFTMDIPKSSIKLIQMR